ncbi:uracil-DNA glycosylase [Glaciecola sp. KUL10]|uniref:uracil-DNA glycosylase n=1 Tax=Glaciecola sp. (strain KUL10) TaxID=2161813 RepID=UPI000D784DB4|nr:uracil-DNA glycosylase [Glaciecola sp. KUL10]GBL05561.1 uracil-DNA glycosylase [Glaciecola sp. KUL10]
MKHWQALLAEQKDKAYFKEALAYIQQRRSEGVTVYPPDADVFNAFKFTTPENLKVVILGQDPYHGPNQAHGLCFSVLKGNKIPPSLRNIYKELSSDIDNFITPTHGELTHWAQQGVLMLNTVLTVEQGQANAHKGIGWEKFTDAVIMQISEKLNGVIFVLWGAPAQKKTKLIDTAKHHIVCAPHPSPLSAHRGFLGCGHFSEINRILHAQQKPEIDWHIPN